MTTASPIPAAEASPRMADPFDTEAQAPAKQAKASTARPRLRDQAAENPLLTLFGTIIIALLVFGLGTINFRIDDVHARFDDVHDRIDETNLRIDRLEDKVDRLEERVIAIDLKLTALIADLDRKVTALIAHLNATAEVDNALEGRLATPDTDADAAVEP